MRVKGDPLRVCVQRAATSPELPSSAVSPLQYSGTGLLGSSFGSYVGPKLAQALLAAQSLERVCASHFPGGTRGS